MTVPFICPQITDLVKCKIFDSRLPCISIFVILEAMSSGCVNKNINPVRRASKGKPLVAPQRPKPDFHSSSNTKRPYEEAFCHDASLKKKRVSECG